MAPDRTELKEADYAKLLDDKIAGTEAFKFAGGQGAAGEKWRKTIRGYVGTKCKMLLLAMDWAEGFDSIEINGVHVHEQIKLWMTELDILRLGEVLWGFLNICLLARPKRFSGRRICWMV